VRGLEIVKDKESKEAAPQHVQLAMDLCRDRGLLIGRGGNDDLVDTLDRKYLAICHANAIEARKLRDEMVCASFHTLAAIYMAPGLLYSVLCQH
jgi:hypothetical protein